MTDRPSLTRRGALAAGGVALGTLGAGCTGGDAADDTGPGTSSGDSGGGDDSGGPPSLADHPVSRALDAQPRLGPAPGEATGTIVAFEDPSCPRCAAFERTTVPQVRSNLVETGQASFVLRTVPLVYPWGEPAIHALEATYDRSADAMWALLSHYFETQDAFGPGNVLDRTRTFLRAETDVDAAAVVADAENRADADAVETDLAAAEAAGVSGTPTVFLFRDGQYRTRATGSVSYDLVTRALGL